MAAGSVNPFLSDSDEEAERRTDGPDKRRSPDDVAPGLSIGALSPHTDSEPGASLLSSSRTSPGVESVSVPGAAAAAVSAGGSGEPRLSVDAIAAQLLRDQYILTALELHTELLEAGRELPRLRDYFSNPGNFERQSGTPPACKEPVLGPAGQLSKYWTLIKNMKCIYAGSFHLEGSGWIGAPVSGFQMADLSPFTKGLSWWN